MAAVGLEVIGSWFLPPGVVGFFAVVLLLSVFLTALCSDCTRRSFELRDSEADKNPSALISVVKLEETRVNPTLSQIQSDEKEFHPVEDGPIQITPWRSHLGAPQTNTESRSEEEGPIQPTPWRSHLMAPPSRDVNAPSPPDSAHIYHTAGGGRGIGSSDDNASSLPANHGERDARSADLSDRNRNSPPLPLRRTEVDG